MIGSNLFFRFNDLINFNLSNQDKIYINRIFYQGLVESLFNLIPWIKIKIDGIKNLKNIDLKKKNYIFICNHVSFLDNFILTQILGYIKNYHYSEFIGAGFINKWWIVGKVFKGLGMLSIEFIDNDPNLKNQYSKESVSKLTTNCIQKLNDNHSLWLFPEGRLNDNPKILNEIRGGAFKFQQKTGVPIIILGMKNVNKIWERNGYPTGLGEIKVKIFDKPRIYTDIETYRKDVKNTIETWINSQ